MPREMRARVNGLGPRRFAPSSTSFFTSFFTGLIVEGDPNRGEWQQCFKNSIVDPVGAYA
jgi:hypothetical protein